MYCAPKDNLQNINLLKNLNFGLAGLSDNLKTKNQISSHVPIPIVNKPIIKSNKPVVIDVYGDRCGPCKTMAPIFDALEQELGAKYAFERLDVYQSNARDLYNISSIPTFVFLKDDRVVGKVAGMRTKEQLRANIIQFLGN